MNNKHLLLIFMFATSSCKGIPTKTIDTIDRGSEQKNVIVSSPKISPITHSNKRKNSSIRNFPYLYGKTLYFWKTPQEDRKLQEKLIQDIDGYFSTYHLMNASQKKKVVLPYVGSLLQALKKRNPEKDAMKFIVKKQRFMLAHDDGRGGGRLPSRDYHTAMFKGISHKARTKCKHYYSHPSSFKIPQGSNKAISSCHNNPTCDQYSDLLATYIFRWNRTILKSCEKN